MPDKESAPTTKRPLAVSIPANRPNYVVGSDTYSFILTGKDTAGAYAFKILPPETFDQLMTAGELEIVKAAVGE